MYGLLDLQTTASVELGEAWKDSRRLQSNVKPISYDLMIRRLELERFSGSETIVVEVVEQTNYFAVHVQGLTMTSSKVSCVSDEAYRPAIKKTFLYAPHSFWVVEMESNVRVGTYKLDFEFEGSSTRNNKSGGLNKWNYFNEKLGSPRMIVASLHDRFARKTFPCFDEPQVKAKFRLRLVKPMEKYVGMTNEMIEKEEFGPEKNEMTVFFRETKPMSTFMMGFLLCDLKESTPLTIDNQSNKLNVRMHATPDKIDKTLLAKEISLHVTKFLIDYFETPFPLDKLDLIAVPDLPVTPPELWGFILFPEASLLYDDHVNSVRDKKNIALGVTREISRQWVGGLVTMHCYDDFSLLEGFVRFMQYKALEEGVKNCRDWKLGDQIMNDIVHPLLETDSLPHIHPVLDPDSSLPIRPELETDSLLYTHPLIVQMSTSQVDSDFFRDAIFQNKGVVVLKMLESFIGRETFRRGVHRFLQTYTLSNAKESDLWECMNEEFKDPDVNIGEVMDTWTKQPGYPVIYAIKRANTWVLSQNRFLSYQGTFCNPSDSPYRFKWDVPVHYIQSNEKKPVLVWFRRSEECVRITIPDRSVSYLKFNHAQTGFYRVNYEGCLWRQFSQILQQDHTRFDILDRSNLLDDIFHLAEAGQADYQYAFDIARYIEKEQDYLPWATFARNLKRLMARLPNTACSGLLLKFVRSLVSRFYGSAEGQYGWNTSTADTHAKRLLRCVILEVALMSNVKECISDLNMKFKEWLKTGEIVVHPDLARLLLCYGMREAVCSIEDLDLVWSRYLKETSAPIRNYILEGLANVKEPWIVMSILEDSKGEMRDVDYMAYLRYLSQNLYNYPLQWYFVRNEWAALHERLVFGAKELRRLVVEGARKFNTQAQLDEVKLFLEQHPDVAHDNDKEIIATIERNLRSVRKHKVAISNWLMDNLHPVVSNVSLDVDVSADPE